ncbi:MAG: FAD-dependent oxidoreductase [Deltaproteobacteria bacterium]|nr:FAD-dependent oxidoreductase [Deltaproteobacteria bacterium]
MWSKGTARACSSAAGARPCSVLGSRFATMLERAAHLSRHERRILMRLLEAAIPAGEILRGADAGSCARAQQYLAEIPGAVAAAFRAGLWVVETATIARHGRPFSLLSLEARQRVLRRWEQSPSFGRRIWLRALLTPLKMTHFDRPDLFEKVGCRYFWPPVQESRPRWLAQVRDGRAIDRDESIECDVVVVGTGAGGAAAAYELARRGRAVLMLEEGDYHRRPSFTGRPADAYRNLYRDRALSFGFGNAGFPLWSGRAVGGTTVINSGTCLRASARVLAQWRERFGLPAEFSERGLGPYYERVEAMLQVALADPKHVGKIGEIVARGAARLGYRHSVLRRNAPDCDAQGVCCMGCPTGAKRSTDVSYVPAALERGAQLVTAARAKRVEVAAGRACGVVADLRSGRRLRVAAQAVVVAGGTLATPLLLRHSGLCLTSGMLGRNLSVHPATKVVALFDERVDMASAIPQSYAVEHFADQGLMLEGGSASLDVTAMAIPWTGPRFAALIERHPHLAMFGAMVEDRGLGRVLPGPRGSPLVVYNLRRREIDLLHRGLVVLCEIFQAAGARRVLPFVHGHDEVSTPAELGRLRRSWLRAGDFEVSAFHALGTCRIGTDPRRSCLGPDHEAHDTAGLYVCDGSAVPSSVGVNPQMTIMALALRAAEIIDSRL